MSGGMSKNEWVDRDICLFATRTIWTIIILAYSKRIVWKSMWIKVKSNFKKWIVLSPNEVKGVKDSLSYTWKYFKRKRKTDLERSTTKFSRFYLCRSVKLWRFTFTNILLNLLYLKKNIYSFTTTENCF